MNNGLHPDMLEATRLTQAGRLTEATALLQRLLQSRAAPEPVSGTVHSTADMPAGHVPCIIDVVPETVEVTDRQPPSGAKEASVAGAGSRRPLDRAEEIVQPPLREALRSLLERVRRTGVRPGPGGLTQPFPVQTPEVIPDGARLITGSYSNQAGSRAYKLYIPSGYSGQALPLIVMLHGCTQSPDDFAAGTRMNAVAEADGCLVA